MLLLLGCVGCLLCIMLFTLLLTCLCWNLSGEIYVWVDTCYLVWFGLLIGVWCWLLTVLLESIWFCIMYLLFLFGCTTGLYLLGFTLLFWVMLRLVCFLVELVVYVCVLFCLLFCLLFVLGLFGLLCLAVCYCDWWGSVLITLIGLCYCLGVLCISRVWIILFWFFWVGWVVCCVFFVSLIIRLMIIVFIVNFAWIWDVCC